MIGQILEGISFGEPWRLSEQSLSAVIPLLIRNSIDRDYVLLQEVKDKVDIEDTGSIGRARINNRSDRSVFIRKGTLLQGATQARGVTIGTVVTPNSVKEVKIQCVHASMGIRRGAKFSVSPRVAPRMVERTFLNRGSQAETWSSVSRATQSLYSMAASSPGQLSLGEMRSFFADDLIGSMEQVQRFKDDIEEALKKVPADLSDQVGVAIVDRRGVVGVEAFDHTDSWRAFSRSIVRNYADVLTQETSELFEIKMDKVAPAVMTFMEKLSKAKETVVDEAGGSKTCALDGEGIVGEFTEMNGRTIHLIGTRRDDKERRGVMTSTVSYTPLRRTRQRIPAYSGDDEWRDQAFRYKTAMGSYLRKKGSKNILSALREPKPWKNLEKNIKLSTRTLSRRLSEARDLGFVSHKPRDINGRMSYSLTGAGWGALKKAKYSNQT